jgi:hypothetical protein
VQVAETFTFSLDEKGKAVEPAGTGESSDSAGADSADPLPGSPPPSTTSTAAALRHHGGLGPSAGAAGGAVARQQELLRPLAELARLDTCVTVVDASALLDNLASLQTLKVCLGAWQENRCKNGRDMGIKSKQQTCWVERRGYNT